MPSARERQRPHSKPQREREREREGQRGTERDRERQRAHEASTLQGPSRVLQMAITRCSCITALVCLVCLVCLAQQLMTRDHFTFASLSSPPSITVGNHENAGEGKQ